MGYFVSGFCAGMACLLVVQVLADSWRRKREPEQEREGAGERNS